jgi:hypothetical protein
MEDFHMSLHDFSNLAVLDITDESAAMHSGGVSFIGYDGANGTGAGPTQTYSNSAPIGLLQDFSFIGALASVNNTLEAFKISSPSAGKTYKVSFFDNTDFTAKLGEFNLSTVQNNALLPFDSTWRNRTGSVRIERTA